MRHSESQPSGSRQAELETNEERLRREVEDLKRKLAERDRAAGHGETHRGMWHPSAVTIWAIAILVAVLLVAAFFTGYIPLRKRQALIQNEAQAQEQALPRAEVIEVGRSSRTSEMELPGNIQALMEAPILARADGYIGKRLVDIGDRVRSGQPMAQIEAPELDQQVRQAMATLQQARAGLEQAQASYEQGKATLELARVTAQRWSSLASQGIVSRQDNDQYQAQYQAQTANVQALEKAVTAQRSNIEAAEANVARLDEVQGYRVVKAPFDGVVTQRNVDVGALVTAGSTLLFRVAQTGTLRTYVNVPEASAGSVRVGQSAELTVASLPGRSFRGTVVRNANALDPATRTLLVEIQVPNAGGELLPGMYAQVDLSNTRSAAPLAIPADALVVRAQGTQVAVVLPDHTVHLQTIEVGRDYGDRLEVVEGLKEGDTIIANPGDLAREGVKVDPVLRDPNAAKPTSAGGGSRK